MLEIIDRLDLNLRIKKLNSSTPLEGFPEGPEIRTLLSQEDKKKVEQIREGLDATQKSTKMKIQIVRKPSQNSSGLSILVDVIRVSLS